VRKLPLRGPQLAYYLKKRNPELYQKAREIKERYNVTWDEAFAILRGEKKPPQVATTGSETQVILNDVVKRVVKLQDDESWPLQYVDLDSSAEAEATNIND
jgi:hypothetical protein